MDAESTIQIVGSDLGDDNCVELECASNIRSKGHKTEGNLVRIS